MYLFVVIRIARRIGFRSRVSCIPYENPKTHHGNIRNPVRLSAEDNTFRNKFIYSQHINIF